MIGVRLLDTIIPDIRKIASLFKSPVIFTSYTLTKEDSIMIANFHDHYGPLMQGRPFYFLSN